MAKIIISELSSDRKGLKELSSLELKSILGGREVYYVDIDGDSIADVKVIEKKGKIKVKLL